MNHFSEAMDEPEELLDLVDTQDNSIGSITRGEVPFLEQRGIGFTRAVGAFLINSQNELWIPRRGTHKKIAPGGLDFSAGEHVGHNEPYEAAALRGLKEELDIDAAPEKLRLIGTVPPFPGMPYFHQIFSYPSDTVPDFNQQDYDSYEWLSPKEAVARLEAGTPAKEILLPAVQLVAQYLAHKEGDL